MNREQLTFQIWSQKQPLRFKSWWWNQNDFRIVVLKDLIHTLYVSLWIKVLWKQASLRVTIPLTIQTYLWHIVICDWEILCESGCLRMQPKVWGGKIHLKLNIGERPIAHKYREGKMQSTLKREWKGLELVMREAFEAPIRSFLCQSKNETHFWENSVLFFLFGLVGYWFVDKNEMTRETLFFVLSWWSIWLIKKLWMRKGCTFSSTSEPASVLSR